MKTPKSEEGTALEHQSRGFRRYSSILCSSHQRLRRSIDALRQERPTKTTSTECLMRLDTFGNRCRRSAACFLLSTSFFVGCATTRNPALDRARNAYERARQDPAVAGRAAVALDKTKSTLEKVERLWATKKDVAEVEHLV
jgi:hypothetical protein